MKLFVFSAAGIALGCGDPLPPADYAGEVLFHHPEFVRTVQPDLVAERLRYAWFFVRPDAEPAELRASSAPFTPAVSALNVFAAPDDRHLQTSPSGARFGVAYLSSYDDLDGDGAKGADEPFRGDALQGLIYAPIALDAARSPYGRPIPAGYSMIDLPPPCAPTVNGDMDCGVPLGAACSEDGDDCGPGVCRSHSPFWRSGYCVLPADRPCAPANGVRVDWVRGGQVEALWLLACTSDADCPTGAPHFCDPLTGACVPDQGFEMELPGPSEHALCATEDEPPDGPPPPPPPPPPEEGD